MSGRREDPVDGAWAFLSALIVGEALIVLQGPWESPFSEAFLLASVLAATFSIRMLSHRRRVLAEAAEPAAPGPSLAVELGPEVGQAHRCPFCRDDLGVEPLTCQSCGTQHHADCYASAGCTVLGCRQKPQTPRYQPTA